MTGNLFEPRHESLELRYYQREAIDAAYEFLRKRNDNPCIVLPTGAGKTPTMATICNDVVSKWNGRILILAHVKELIEQTAETIHRFFPHLKVGVYSAGLGRRETRADVLVASIQSVHRRGMQLAGSRPFKAVVVDEAHRIPTSGDGMYRRLLDDLHRTNPRTRVIGLTATPYRLKGGYVCGPDHFLNEICYEAGVRELIVKGYLCPLISKGTAHAVNPEQLQIKNGEFTADSLGDAFDGDEVVSAAVAEIAEKTAGRKSVLVFCCNVEHAEHVQRQLEEILDEKIGIVSGTSSTAHRDATIKDFKEGRTRFLCNVNVLTEGFDARQVDCVVLLRSTLSPGLYYQMVGRGLRIHPAKQDCLVLDFGANVLRHGCVDAIKIKSKPSGSGGEAPVRECPECREIVALSYKACTACGTVFPEPEPRGPNHEASAGDVPITSDQVETVTYDVTEVTYCVHEKRNAPEDAPKSMRVSYYDGLSVACEEWVCVEHNGFAWEKADAWWRTRSNEPTPTSAEEAVRLASLGYLAEPTKVSYIQPPGERFKRIVSYELPAKPNPEDVMTYVDEWGVERRMDDLVEINPEDIPF